MESLAGKTAIVTGGSKGIGLAIAHALLDEGVQVAITGRGEASLAAAQDALSGASALLTVHADVRRYTEAKRAVEETVERFGAIDILVNNAGIGIFTSIAEMTPDQWQDVISTNLTGVYNMCNVAIPFLRRQGGGFIINISSLAAKNATTGGGAYCASKAGLNAFSAVLMQELRYDNIRVSCVMPGSVATGFSGGTASKGADWKIAPEEVAEVVTSLLRHHPRSLPSSVELRPSQPPRT